jgi:methionyl-tRNA formyltransferase
MDPKKLRIVFMGTPGFAVESLRALVENDYNVVGVVTAPDKPAGRGQKLSESAVKQYAVSAGLDVVQPEKLKNPEFLDRLASLRADLQIVVAFRMLPEVVWKMPPLGTFNLHASLLPQYRGAAPINWAIINGEKETGITTFLLSHEIDTGQILFTEKIRIGEKDTAGDLHDRLMVAGTELVLKTVDAIANGVIKPIPQDDLLAETAEIKHAPKIFRESMQIDWSKPASEVRNLIRGLSPYPAAWTHLIQKQSGTGSEVKIYYADLADGPEMPPGTIDCDGKNYLKVACGNGWLEITDLQLAGKKRMLVAEFLRGFHAAGNIGDLFHFTF